MSVVVPVYNACDTLHRSVTSIRGQSWPHLEVILVDDGSTDGSSQLCDRYANEDQRIRVVHQANAGLASARNAGIELVRGEFLAFIDADDWIEPDWIRLLVREAEDTRADVVVAGASIDVERDGAVVSRQVQKPPRVVVHRSRPVAFPSDSTSLSLLGYAWNKLYRTTCVQAHEVRFTAGLRLVEDVDFNARMFRAAATVSFVDAVGLHYVQREAQSLGRRYHPDHVELRLHAHQCLREILDAWGVEDLDAVMRPLECALVNSSLRNAARNPGGIESLPGAQDSVALAGLLTRVRTDPTTRWPERLGAAFWRRGHLRMSRDIGAAMLLATKLRDRVKLGA